MEKTIYGKNLWLKALEGNGAAYRKLGILLLKGRGCKRNKKAAKRCLQKAVEAGDERGYLLYHRLFSRGKKVIDDASYLQICQEYLTIEDKREKKRLLHYLALGTRKQKRLIKENFPFQTPKNIV